MARETKRATQTAHLVTVLLEEPPVRRINFVRDNSTTESFRACRQAKLNDEELVEKNSPTTDRYKLASCDLPISNEAFLHTGTNFAG